MPAHAGIQRWNITDR